MNGAVLQGVETFAAGEYAGDRPGELWRFGESDLASIVQNFQRLSSGSRPLHRVPVVVTHDGVQAYGWVRGARGRGELLHTDWQDVVPQLQAAVREGRLKKVSAEVRYDFKDRHGKVYPGPYLYRVAVLGHDVPRVKGLADLPREQWFSEPCLTTERTFRFADDGGFVMADEVTPVVAVETPPVKTATADEVRRFAEQEAARLIPAAIERAVSAAMQPLQKRLEDLDATQKALEQQATQRFAEEKRARIDATLKRLVEQHKVLPAELDPGDPKNPQPTLRDTLYAADAVRTLKFSDAAPEMTQLDMLLAQLERRPAFNFAERIKGSKGGIATEKGDEQFKDVDARTKDYIARLRKTAGTG